MPRFLVTLMLLFSYLSVYSNSEKFISLYSGLRLRTGPDLNFRAIRHLEKGEIVEVIAKGNKAVIENIEGNWVRVKTENKQIGWVFDGYLCYFPLLESPSGYSISYPENWTIREQSDINTVYLQISSYDKLEDIAPGENLSPDQVKIEIFIFNNINMTAEEWVKTLNYIYKVDTEISSDFIIGYSKPSYKIIEHKIFVKNRRAVIMNYYPPDSIFKKAAENIIAGFHLE